MLLFLTFCIVRSFGEPSDWDKAWRNAALQYATEIQPSLTDVQSQFLKDALLDNPPPAATSSYFSTRIAASEERPSASSFYVAPKPPCNDAGTGSFKAPFCTITRGVGACQAASNCTVYLRRGTHRLLQPLKIDPKNIGLTIRGYPREQVVISGSRLLTLDWKPAAMNRQRKCTRYLKSSASYGYDLPDTGNISRSVDHCQALCLQNNDCAAGGWFPDGSFHRCFLKARPARVEKVGMIENSVAFDCTPNGTYIWEAKLGGPHVVALRVNGKRAVRARFPNANPERDWFPVGYMAPPPSWGPPRVFPPSRYIKYDQAPVFREGYKDWFSSYQVGIGGACSIFDPPLSFWCAKDPQHRIAGPVQQATGLEFGDLVPRAVNYRNITGSVAHVLNHGESHWSTWMFEIDQHNDTHLTWTKGGFQGGRPTAFGMEWFLEGVFEELDEEGEWYHDHHTHTLYYVANESPAGSIFEVPMLETLLEARGTQTDPVVNLRLSDLSFTGTFPSFMQPHGVPSGGDWALRRSGAIYLQGTVNATVERCVLSRLDGSALILSGFNQYARITNNEFSFLGANGIITWGYTTGSDPLQPPGTGPDGTTGEFPQNIFIESNFMHMIGLYQTQSSCWITAKSALITLRKNICFNLARAGFNINDGFGGGHDINSNLIFNTCIESGDHGPINTWDRQSFVTKVATGNPSSTPAMINIHHNFLVSNYGADGGGVDNDDGSSFYDIAYNFMVFGGFKAGNFDGHSKLFHGNLVAFTRGLPSPFWMQPCKLPTEQFAEHFFNNTLMLDAGATYITFPSNNDIPGYCGGVHGTCQWEKPDTFKGALSHNNCIHVSGGTVHITGCNQDLSFAEWVKLGHDKGTNMLPALTSSEIIVKAKQLLQQIL